MAKTAGEPPATSREIQVGTRGRRPQVNGQDRTSLACAGPTSRLMPATHRRATRRTTAALPLVFELTNDQRAFVREHGSVLATGLVQHLETSDPDSAARRLDAAARHAEMYGHMSASLCLSLSQTLEEFLRVRTSIQRDIALTAIGRGLSEAKARDLLRSSEVGMDIVLASISAGYHPRATA
jgi:hypothetical protein